MNDTDRDALITGTYILLTALANKLMTAEEREAATLVIDGVLGLMDDPEALSALLMEDNEEPTD